MKAAVAYLRVSTDGQGRSGLGIEAQRRAIARFAEAEGFEVVDEFTEIETGRGADALDKRPQLKDALAAARKSDCAVVVAKLDRLRACGWKKSATVTASLPPLKPRKF